ncbi:carbohydrate esterase family 1 protein [Hyaloscypha variabilis]
MSQFQVVLRCFFISLSLLSWFPVALGAANSLIQIKDFGPNPTNVTFYLYVPSKLQAKPPILVNPHWCHGDASDCFKGTQLATLADTYGYLMIFPDSPNTADKCWDVSSNATLTHNGGGDSLGIVSMVKYTLAKYNADPTRVFSMGTSSGAMMTNVLLGSYPDIFAAGSAWAGVAFGCFAGNGYDVWSDTCATGKINRTGSEWKAIVEAADPGYSGFRPKMQVFHGTADTTLNPQNLQEEIKEWTAVLGLPSTPVKTLVDYYEKGWTTYIYGDSFQATSAAGVTHNIQTNETVVLDWFDLTCRGSGCYSRPS